jgi:hypothetical protein
MFVDHPYPQKRRPITAWFQRIHPTEMCWPTRSLTKGLHVTILYALTDSFHLIRSEDHLNRNFSMPVLFISLRYILHRKETNSYN